MKLPKQVHIPYIGAIWTLSGACMTLVSGVSFLFQTRLFYYNQNDSLLRDTFSSYYIYALVLIVTGIIAFTSIYMIILPSVNKFQQEQAVIEGRSPMYEKLCEIDERMKVIEKRL